MSVNRIVYREGFCYVYYIYDMQLLSQNAECNMGNIFQVSHIFQVIAKYDRKIFANIARDNVR